MTGSIRRGVSPRGAAVSASLVLLSAAVLVPAAGPASATAGTPDFLLYATDSIVIAPRAALRGGAVGAFGAEDGTGRIEVRGARVRGDLYGQSVLLGPKSKVGDVFASHLAARGAKYGSLGDLPDDLPEIAPGPGASEADFDLTVPTKRRAVLPPLSRRVVVEPKGKLVLEGGEYRLESLELGDRARLEVRGPSLLQAYGPIRIGERAFLGRPGKPNAVQLTIIAAGDVDVGARARVKAAIRAPRGVLAFGPRVRAKGSFLGRVISIAERARFRYVPWDPSPEKDPICFALDCHATAGGKVECVKVPVAGAPCDDGNVCTAGDACNSSGECVSGPPLPDPDPNDQNPCFLDACDPVKGYFAPWGTTCQTDGLQCHSAKVCTGTSADCGDFIGQFPPGTACDDGVPNNGEDVCSVYGNCSGPHGPFDCKANGCGTPPVLDCWLDEHPAFKSKIVWLSGGQQHAYAQWPLAWKQELAQAFLDAWNWIQGGLVSFQGTPLPDPLPNALTLADTDPAWTEFPESQARPMYMAKVAHSLALEASGAVPWSMCDYTPEMIQYVLHYYETFGPGVQNPQYYSPRNVVVPAHPTVTYAFLANAGLLGTSTADTIHRLLDWGRRLKHHAYGTDTLNLEMHWGYRGLPPVSYILSGTCNQHPATGFGHWTMGCSGTTGFLKDVLQAANIPVRPWGYCGHRQVIFPSESMYLGHGDDPYSYFKEGHSVVPPLGAILIDEVTYQSWFAGPPQPGCPAVGRRPAQLAAQLLPDTLVSYHCVDVKNGESHATSSVAQALAPAYTVAELETQNLWASLDQRLVDLGFDPSMGACYLPGGPVACPP